MNSEKSIEVRALLTANYRGYNVQTAVFNTPQDKVFQQVRTLLDGGSVKRFHTMRTLTENTVGEHSHGVAFFCLLLAGDKVTTGLLRAAILHDMAEYKTGDMPSFSKRIIGMRQELGHVEDLILDSVDLGFDLTPYEAAVLKLADCADGMLFSIREMMLGSRNPHIKLSYSNYGSYVNEKLQTVSDDALITNAGYVFRVLAQLKKEATK